MIGPGELRGRLFLIAVGFLVSLAASCTSSVAYGVDESLAFPPTATFPVLAAATLPSPQPASSLAPETYTPTTAPQIAVRAELNNDGEDEAQPVAEQLIESLTPSPTPQPTATATTTRTPAPSPTPCTMPGKIVTNYFDSKYGGRINYRVYLPPCYSDTGRTYPTLYMLPGNIHTDTIWDELGLDEAVDAGIGEKRTPPMLIAMLSGGQLANYTSGGPGSYESFMLEEFIPYFEGNYCALPSAKARAIGGLSRGGYWALEIAFRHPEEFLSVGGHSAALVDLNGGPEINPSNTGLTNDLGDLRIYLDIGENDWLLYNLQRLHEEMTAIDRAHTWVLNPGIHEESYWATHVEEYVDWYAEPWLAVEAYPPCRAISAGYSP